MSVGYVIPCCADPRPWAQEEVVLRVDEDPTCLRPSLYNHNRQKQLNRQPSAPKDLQYIQCPRGVAVVAASLLIRAGYTEPPCVGGVCTQNKHVLKLKCSSASPMFLPLLLPSALSASCPHTSRDSLGAGQHAGLCLSSCSAAYGCKSYTPPRKTSESSYRASILAVVCPYGPAKTRLDCSQVTMPASTSRWAAMTQREMGLDVFPTYK